MQLAQGLDLSTEWEQWVAAEQVCIHCDCQVCGHFVRLWLLWKKVPSPALPFQGPGNSRSEGERTEQVLRSNRGDLGSLECLCWSEEGAADGEGQSR